MTVTCPNGHRSEADDYCDVCGSPIDAAARAGSGSYAAGPASAARPGAAPAGSTGRSSLDLGPAPPSGAASPAAPESLECPNCQAQNPPGALFCEACGYDFTTGAMPRVAGGGGETAGVGAEAPSGAAAGTAAGTPGVEQSSESRPSDAPEPSPGAQQAPPTPTPSVQKAPPAPASSAQHVPAGKAFEWLAEVWVDPDWYQTQEVEDPCPSPGLPVIIPIRARSVLLGRVSQSRNTHPEIDLSSDPGVSRRHAQLTTDGVRWFVEDLGSSNGTFVGPAAGRLPDDPIAVGPKTELGDDDRLYVGAWSRVVVRKATPDEVEVYA